jgi:predicted  nucleic acid-binding Zn-ribbon protein
MKVLLKLSLLVGFNRVSAATLNQVTDTSAKKLPTRPNHKKIDKNVAATNKLLEEYRNLNQQIDGLKFYTKQLSQQVDSQQKIIDDVEYSMSRISTIERQLPALIQNMVTTLEQFVTLDAPFHREERHQRVDQ